MVGFGQKRFILAIHLLTKAERDRIELWMTSRKSELSEEGEKKEEDKIVQGHPSNDQTSGPSKIDTDLILIDDEDEEIECCYDSKEQSINQLKTRLFSQTTGKDEKSSLELPYENKTVRPKIRPGQSILKGRQTKDVKPAEMFDAQAALSKLLKKINKDEKCEKTTIGQLETDNEKEGIVDIELEIEREKPDEEDAEHEADDEAKEDISNVEEKENDALSKGRLAKNDEKEGVVDIEQQMEIEKPHQEKEFEEMDSEEKAKAEEVEQEEDVEDIQARPFNSKIPNLIFSTLF